VGLLLASLLAGGFFLADAAAAIDEHPAPALDNTVSTAPAVNTRTVQKFTDRPSLYFKRNWGVDIVGVHPVSSGQMLEFRYRVLDEIKAKPLFEKTLRPYLIDEATGTRLAVPAMENVGDLRQDFSPKPDRTYFMIFGNPGKLVKTGSRVSIVIGDFRLDGLMVD
jgi:hypothetical protein